MKKAYCTYKWRLLGGYHSHTYAIECNSVDEAWEAARDIYSYCGIMYVNVNKCGRLPKGTEIISYESYKKGKF